MIALCEIGTRALSPATNDPGTAIEVIAVSHRVLDRTLRTERSTAVNFARVRIEAPRLETIVDDAFRLLSRDAASILEVEIRLQMTLAALAAAAPDRAGTFTRSARDALLRAKQAIAREDYRVLQSAASKAQRAALSKTSRAARQLGSQLAGIGPDKHASIRPCDARQRARVVRWAMVYRTAFEVAPD